MEVTIKAWETRNVTARDLSRRIAQLLNEIENDGHGLVVLRHGQPAALLVPLEPKGHRAPRKVSIEEREEEPFEMPELDEGSRRLLLEMARCAPEPYDPDDWGSGALEFARLFVRLELNGLAEKSVGGGRWLTESGQLVAAKLVA
ncbi:MAG: type II toxin-antitoxin system Phd/YefM family antitoxin [Actinomycetota bacterium]